MREIVIVVVLCFFVGCFGRLIVVRDRVAKRLKLFQSYQYRRGPSIKHDPTLISLLAALVELLDDSLRRLTQVRHHSGGCTIMFSQACVCKRRCRKWV